MSGIVLKAEKISTRDVEKRERLCEERAREREYNNREVYYMKKGTKMAMRLKTGIEPNWFGIMPCASIYSDVRSTPEVSRMFKGNLEYT